ncbi:hypothetical protein [Streptomyces sp. NBC_01760]|uniref:hypothetical protein n=1 Tax=Streptomyces sp. NBC_01760 TaxID=2975931 RepID=UPI002DD976E4|nr:hypothetical protein [Streptomyces sp. NBC_01760]WSC66977.1 hypothetical protein OG807_00025 [Streptomyces sp. NBC_01760]WSC74315.1 hypothetical protein OG807_41185 [Streptomyces sp. NBC_01760]
MSRLLVLEAQGELRTEHARLVASGAGVSLRTVWRWLAAAREEGRTQARERARFTITPELHARLARWCGNAAAVHRELLAEAGAAGGSEGDVARGVAGVPSLATLHRAVRRDLNPGQRAALSGGERARRRSDVHLRRPPTWRNACWEGDRKHVPVEVDLDGELVFPWVTWFIDCATNAITGAAVTPHQPSRDGILAALRIALSRDGDGPYGPIGSPSALVRIDRGQDFLSRTVTSALATFAVPVYPVQAYQPRLKGTVENLNRCAQRMLFASLPRYTHQPTDTTRPRDRSKDTTAPLSFTAWTFAGPCAAVRTISAVRRRRPAVRTSSIAAGGMRRRSAPLVQEHLSGPQTAVAPPPSQDQLRYSRGGWVARHGITVGDRRGAAA